jgi:uncharacterized Ntn-hydrolase superfamily protein
MLKAPLAQTKIFLPIMTGIFLMAFSGYASATWSIVVSNSETGELAIGSATCVPGLKLKLYAGVMVVGKGAGQAQAAPDFTGENREKIANGLLQGLTAEEILELLKNTDPHIHTHQYGIVDLLGGAATHTGSKTGAWTSGLVGHFGPMAYAIQGNVLTGEEVVIHAEEALIHTPGDLGQKLMAAMQAAKYYGGDGRCSCDESKPAECGSPPVRHGDEDDSWKSAHVGYMVLARIGDVDGTFSLFKGFANGSYYMDLRAKNSPQDPVDTLQDHFDAFRASKSGHPDHLLSEKTIHPKMIRADGLSKAYLYIALMDIDNQRVYQGVQRTLSITHHPDSAGATKIGPVEDHGDGTYTVMLSSTLETGTDIFQIVVNDAMTPGNEEGAVTLYPFPTLEVKAP